MSWTAPPTYTTGQLMTAAIANAQWRDNLNFLRTVIDDNGHLGFSVASVSADYTTAAGDDVVKVDASGAARAITLLTPAGSYNKRYDIKKIDSSANAVTVAAQSAKTIDGASNYVLTVQNQSVTFQYDGTNWIIV